MKKALLTLTTMLAMVGVTTACDDDEETFRYRATLTQINPQASVSIPRAAAEIVIQGDDAMQIIVEGLGLDAVSHPMFLSAGENCPTAAADLNTDGVVDFVEGQAVYGGILLTLDANIATQAIEPGTFPFGSSPSYLAISDFDNVIDAIKGPDPLPNDFFVKIDDDDDLDLEHRTIVMHGVAAGLVSQLPSLQGMGDMELPATVPILCGRVYRVS